jgi:hypothetical protein
MEFGVQPTRSQKWGLFVPRKIMSSGQAAADHRQPLPASTPESSPGYLAKLDALA